MSCAAAFTSSNGPLTMKKERERARARGDGERKAGSEFPSFLRSNWWCLHQQAFYNVECRRPRPQPPSSGLDSTGNSSDISNLTQHLDLLNDRSPHLLLHHKEQRVDDALYGDRKKGVTHI
ncbi:hypothetical protein OsI_06974 [Oryza sativa Indica Group]|uniref:Uncharacterized protein n=1 Tax=Oryza sativa subsp. indica TaxID=39946 RepID=B8AGB9_ORYSI|nr:hypothetical protein OsI_06974 [Oryza sativa Indica Group]